MELVLPLTLENGVELLSQSEDGVFQIRYRKQDGETGIVFWPDRFKRFKESNPNEGKAVKIVQAFMIDRLCGDS